MWSSIVVGTDGSATAAEAVRQAAALAALSGARLSVVHAFSPVTAAAAMAVTAGMVVDAQTLLGEQRRLAEDVLAQAVAGIDALAVARPGAPAEVLMEVAAEQHADLVVVGSRGLQGVQRFLLGSVPNRVTHSAVCSVLVVHTC